MWLYSLSNHPTALSLCIIYDNYHIFPDLRVILFVALLSSPILATALPHGPDCPSLNQAWSLENLQYLEETLVLKAREGI